MTIQRSTLKGLLLGSAAGLIAVAGAQAADLPVKARPVQYVKVCTLYGDGYYYIPGSDTCIKIGGYVRADTGFGVTGGRTPQYAGTAGAQDRTVSPYSTRYRANIALDTRTETQYGSLRTLTSLHFQNQNQSESFNVARAFVQWAGFTFGRVESFTDTWSLDASLHYAQQQNHSDTGADGVNEVAYSFELGDGAVLSFGGDERRTKSLANLSLNTTLKIGSEPANSFAGEQYPDPFAAFRIDQAWGRWSAALVAHDVNATYYTSTGATGACPNGTVALTTCGHPADRVGWVILTGGELKLPMIAAGDRVGYFAHYGQGTSAYSGGGNLSSPALFGAGNTLAAGWLTDGVFVNGSGIELTTTWTVGAGYEHYWMPGLPSLKTSVFGAYTQVLYDQTAKGYFATNVCPSAAAGGQAGFNAVTNCNPNWSFFQGGIRTQWQPLPLFYMGVELAYTRVFTAFNGSTANLSGGGGNPVSGARPSGIYTIGDEGTWSVIFRVQRSFASRDST
jgi:hypothetical protein